MVEYDVASGSGVETASSGTAESWRPSDLVLPGTRSSPLSPTILVAWGVSGEEYPAATGGGWAVTAGGVPAAAGGGEAVTAGEVPAAAGGCEAVSAGEVPAAAGGCEAVSNDTPSVGGADAGGALHP